MRYQKALRIPVVFVAGVLLLSACNSVLTDFEENDTYDYKLFDLLDNYPALHDALDTVDPNSTPFRKDQCDKHQIRLDQCVANNLLADAIDEHYAENTKVIAGQYVTIDATRAGIFTENPYPMQNTVQLMRHLIYRINNQDTLDKETGSSTYATDFFGFLDTVSDPDLLLGGDLVAVLGGMSNYLVDHLTPALMRKEVEFANDDRDETPCQTATYNADECNHVLARHKLLAYQQTSVGKSNLRADAADVHGLGNAVRGNQSLLMAVFELGKDSDFRDSLANLIRQTGVFLSGSVSPQPGSQAAVQIADIAETLVRNIQSYFTTGGENATGIYTADNTTTYSSVELRNTLRELQTGITRMVLRSDRDDNSSLIYEIDNVNGKKLYVFDEFIKSLKSIGWDPSSARVEESLEDLIKYDQFGRDRTTNAAAHQTSQLESLFFLTSIATTYGWTDANKDGVTGESGKNYGHGHGNVREGAASNPSPTKSAGSSMNDALYAMGTNEISVLGIPLNQYQLTFNTDDQEHLFRSLYPFTIASRDDNRFYFDQNYPISYFVTGPVGAPGSPDGGRAPKDNGGNFILNGYMPFNPLGDENDNIALTTIVALWHICWNGYGPYYYDPSKANTSPETVELYGKTWNKVYRANGKLYALVYKAANGNWEYLYPPNDDSEPLYPMAFYVGELVGSATLSSTATVRITIDSNVRTVTFPAGTWNRNSVIARLKSQINIPFKVIPFGKNKFRISGSPDSAVSPKIVKIEYVSGPNAVELLLGGNGTLIERVQSRAEFWNSVNISDYYMGYYYDLLGLTNKYSTIIRDDDGDIIRVSITGTDEPSGVLTEELLSDKDPSRACASQEEAFFRNYQWFFNERKHLLIMPQRLLALGLESGIIYIYQEANGYYGFANARPFRGNQMWAKANTTGNSTIPGDHRMGVVADFSSVAQVIGQSETSVYNSTLGGGAGFSSILAHNLTSLARLAFPTVTSGTLSWTDVNGNPKTETIVDGLVPSYAFNVGDDTWDKRNAIVPILMSMFNALRANTDYQHSNTAGLVPFFDTMTILLKPFTYYQKGTGDVPHNTWKYRVLGDGGSDAYFLKSSGEFYMSGSTFNKPDTWFGSWTERNYFQPDKSSTLFSVLVDSNRYPANTADKKLMDGILPLLFAENPVTHERPRVLTQALKLLVSVGKDEFNDPDTIDYNASSQDFDNNWQSWGARRKLFYGLEQTMTLSKHTKGRFTALDETSLTETLPAWMFTSGVDGNSDGMPDDMRPEEIFANIDQNILIGTNGTDIAAGELGYQMGLAYLPTDWEKNPDKLTLFRTYLEMLAEVLKPKSDANVYSVVENCANVIDKFLNGVMPTDNQIKGLVHTLGIIATTYDANASKWNAVELPLTGGNFSFSDHAFDLNDTYRVDELYRVAAQYGPILNTIKLALDDGIDLNTIDARFDTSNSYTTSTINYIYDSAVYFNALLNERDLNDPELIVPGLNDLGLIEYVLDVVDTENDPDHNFKEVFKELYDFLDEPLLTNFNSSLWNDVAKLMAGMVQVLTRNDHAGAMSDMYENFGFEYNGP